MAVGPKCLEAEVSRAEVTRGRFDKGPMCLGADLVVGPKCL